MSEQTAPEWRDCADPDELAAAVAAGVEVEVVFSPDDVWTTGRWNETADQFAEAIRRGARYRVPTSWTWHQEPPAPDEVVAPDDDWCEAVLNDLNSIIHGHCGSDGSDDAHCDWVNDLANEVVRYFQRHDVLDALSTPPPDPPTPPDGCDAVWLPTDVVDGVAEMLATYTVETSLRDACREAQARRGTIPTPEWLTPEVVGRIEDAMLNGDTEDPPPTRTPSSLGDAMRLIGRYTESEGGDSPETTNARRGLFSGYDAWVGAGRPESTTPPPAPPWPGAVLSGLTDEDGVPTWLAQAGQVRGEQVRIWHDEPWVTTHGSWADSRWVEVRAPRAVPEPETERVEPVTVRFYEAFGPTDFTDGRGPRKSMGVYPTEQEAWDSINDLPGVQGTHPSKGNTHPLRSREYEDCGPVLTWQRYREVVGRSGDYYVVERQVVGTPLKATP